MTFGKGNADHLHQVPKCTKLRKDRQPCRGKAVRGTTPPVCRMHAGRKLSAIRAEEAVREVAIKWGLGDTKVDPGELLLRLVSQSALRADAYAAELARIVAAKDGDLRKALTGDTFVATAEGEPIKTGEYVRAITKLEAEERDRAGSLAAKAVAAGLAERQVRAAERYAQMAAEFVNAVLGDLGLAGTPQATAAIQRHLRIVEAA